ncbi:NADPH:quinone oxidoreductase family protein [Pigmentiphaga soli]|uniref:NADPH:quinone oxidoreductase family protein n=1 Tax=Pigmentiphaga soli TaxID=1007095 RepID=A0ABP8GKI2_9BURK
MKALVCRRYGPLEALAIEDIAPPPLGDGDVRIAVRAASVNPPDVLMPAGKYQVRPELPFVPGIEAMGTVMETGADVSDLRPGERVMTYAGQGCYAEQVVVPRRRVERVPAGMDDAQAAGFVLVYSTAYHGLVDCGGLAAGQAVAVLGAAGGIGLCAIQIAKAFGATVVAAAGSAARRDACLAAGADLAVDGAPEGLADRLRRATGGRGADVVLDVVGGDATEPALRAVAPYGRLLIAGYASGAIPMIKGNLVLLKQARVVGVSYRLFLERTPELAAANLRRLCELYEAGLLRPQVGAQFPFERVVDALRALGERHAVGKIAVRMA